MDSRLLGSASVERLTGVNYPVFPERLLPPQITEENLIQTLEGFQDTYPDMTLDDFYSLNSLGFRSDEFLFDHGDKQHVLFAGCSHTFGQGNLLEDVWAYKLYQYLGGDEANSGYFNVGRPGATYSEIARQVVSYAMTYGVPDKVFVLLPDVYREYVKIAGRISSEEMPAKEIIKGLDINYINSNIASAFHSMSALIALGGGQAYVTSNNIYHCEIDGDCFLDPRQAMPNFYMIDYPLTEQRVYDYATTWKSDRKDFAFNAFDVMHDGYAFQHAWYEHFVDIIEGRVKENEREL